jgi:DNA-nicking Smr family endonuclease
MGKKRITELGGGQNDSADASAFRAAVRDVKPLVQVAPPKGLAKHAPRGRLRRSATAATENLDDMMPLIATPSRDEDASDEAASRENAAAGSAALSFHRAGVRVQVMRRLRRGLYPTEDELDLHGLTQTAARDSLADFIARSRDSGRRCVRIVHGKGYRSGARGAVLKTAVDLWLRRHTDVMAFTSARAIDGGTGAVYVLLRG